MIADSREHGNFSFVHVHDISNCELARNRRDIITVGTVISLSFRVLLVLPPHHAGHRRCSSPSRDDDTKK